MDEEAIKQMANDVNNVIEATANPLKARIKKLESAIKSVAKKLRTKRKHPLDIIPIENPRRLAEELEAALAKAQPSKVGQE
jgi:hypothetical protein